MIDLAPIQEAIYVALTAPPAPYPVYDPVPEDLQAPYIAIGDPNVFNDELLSVPSADADFVLHTWSRSHGKRETWEILAFIRSRLDHQAIGAGCWACTEDFYQVIEDPASREDSRLYHGIARYRIRAE